MFQKLKRVYGRSDNVPAISLTGLYKNSIAYAVSNTVVILDYVENSQKCLQAHVRNLKVIRERSHACCKIPKSKILLTCLHLACNINFI